MSIFGRQDLRISDFILTFFTISTTSRPSGASTRIPRTSWLPNLNNTTYDYPRKRPSYTRRPFPCKKAIRRLDSAAPDHVPVFKHRSLDLNTFIDRSLRLCIRRNSCPYMLPRRYRMSEKHCPGARDMKEPRVRFKGPHRQFLARNRGSQWSDRPS